MLISIAIPTYNRAKDLIYNLSLLESIILRNELQSDVEIFVSNNASTDSTKDDLENFRKSTSVPVTVFHQKQNIGLEANFLFVSKKAKGHYVMLLGDDDYISQSYLLACLYNIKANPHIGCIFGCYKTINATREETGGGRDLDLPNKTWRPGIASAIENTAKFHQMSGILFKKEGILEEYQKAGVHNLYPQVFIGTYLCLHTIVMQITQFPILVTQTPRKAWGYGDDGLLQDVFQNYKALRLSPINRLKLENSFLTKQIWRIWMYKPEGAFWKCVRKVCLGKNTSLLGSIYLFAKILKTYIREKL